MIKIIRENNSGKTKDLMEFANNMGATIACKNPGRAKEKAKNYGYLNVKFCTYGEAIAFKLIAEPGDILYIDDLDAFVSYMGGTGYTLSTN